MTRPLLGLLGALAFSGQPDHAVVVQPKGALDLRVQTEPPGARALAEEQVTAQSSAAANTSANASAIAAEQALANETARAATFAVAAPDAESLPMACSDSLIKASEISTSSCKDAHGVCVSGPLQSLMDGQYDHAWQPKQNSGSEWIMWNWTQPVMIHYIQTSGYPDIVNDGTIQEYKLEYLTSDGMWEYYVDSAGRGAESWTILDGFATAPEAKMNALNPPIESVALRMRPVKWKRNIALRASIRGCNADTVKGGDLTLNAPLRNIIPERFRDLSSLVTELRLRVSEAVGASVDIVQVGSVNPAPPPNDRQQTVARIEILPKAGYAAPAQMLSDLAYDLGDTGSVLYQWAQTIQKREDLDSYSCKNVNCHAPNGECAGGQCFCFSGYEGADCSIHTKAAQTDALRGVKLGDSDANVAIGDLKPLPILSGIPHVTSLDSGKSTPRLTNAELEAEIDQIASDEREEHLGDEEGISAITKTHGILVILVLVVVFCMWSMVIFCTYGKLETGKEGSDTGTLPRASLLADTEE